MNPWRLLAGKEPYDVRLIAPGGEDVVASGSVQKIEVSIDAKNRRLCTVTLAYGLAVDLEVETPRFEGLRAAAYAAGYRLVPLPTPELRFVRWLRLHGRRGPVWSRLMPGAPMVAATLACSVGSHMAESTLGVVAFLAAAALFAVWMVDDVFPKIDQEGGER